MVPSQVHAIIVNPSQSKSLTSPMKNERIGPLFERACEEYFPFDGGFRWKQIADRAQQRLGFATGLPPCGDVGLVVKVEVQVPRPYPKNLSASLTPFHHRVDEAWRKSG